MSKNRTAVHENYEIPDGLDFTGKEAVEFAAGTPEYDKLKAIEGEDWQKYVDTMIGAGIDISFDETGDKFVVTPKTAETSEVVEDGSGVDLTKNTPPKETVEASETIDASITDMGDVKSEIEKADTKNKEDLIAQASKIEESLKRIKKIYESSEEKVPGEEIEAVKEEGEEMVSQIDKSDMGDAIKTVVKDKVEKAVEQATAALEEEIANTADTGAEKTEEPVAATVQEAYKGKPLPTFEELQKAIREDLKGAGSEGAVSGAKETDGNNGIKPEGNVENGNNKKKTAQYVASVAESANVTKKNGEEGEANGAVTDSKETDGNNGIKPEGEVEAGSHKLPEPGVYIAERASKIKRARTINETIKVGGKFKAKAFMIKESSESKEEYNIKEGDEVEIGDVDVDGETVIAKHGDKEVKLNADDFLGDSPKFENEEEQKPTEKTELTESEEGDQFGNEIKMINKWFETYDGAEEFDWDGKSLSLKDKDGKQIKTLSRDELSKEISGFPTSEVKESKRFYSKKK